MKKIFEFAFFAILVSFAVFGLMEFTGFNDWHESMLKKRGLK